MAEEQPSVASDLIYRLSRVKHFAIADDAPKASLDALVYVLIDMKATVEEKCNTMEEYIGLDANGMVNTPDDFIRNILSMEMGITREQFFSWLEKKDCDYGKWSYATTAFLLTGFPEIRDFLSVIIKSKKTNPITRSKAAEAQLYCAIQNDSKYLVNNPLPSDWSPEPKLKIKSRKLRVAFTSEKFATNYISSQTVYQDAIFSGLPDDVEVWLFSLKYSADQFTEPYRNRAHKFIDISGLSDLESRAVIKKANIDIVVDLFGATPEKYWRFFENSIRVSSFDVDCFIKDYYHYNLEEKNNFAEWKKAFTTLEPVPNQFFWPNLSPVVINPKAPSSSNNYITFGVFSRLLKIHPHNYDVWAKLMHEVPKSIIAFSFIQLQKQHQYIIEKEFKERGIRSNRISFFPRTDGPKHLTKYNSVDVVLDTFPVGSGFSALDALWMGVPIVGLIKETDTVINTKKAYAMLKKGNWATKNELEYIDTCKKIALDVDYRVGLRHRLRQEVIASDLVNGKKFSENMYAGLKKIALDNKNGKSLSKAPDNKNGKILSKALDNKNGKSLSKAPDNKNGKILSKAPDNKDGKSLSKAPDNKNGKSLSKAPDNKNGKSLRKKLLKFFE